MHVIVTDANILLAVAVGLAAEKAFRKPITAYTTSHTYAELLKYLPHFSERYKVSIEDAILRIEDLPIEIKPQDFYASKLPEAKALMEAKDPDDVELLALALFLDAPVWSNDDHFKNLPVKRYTTAEFLKALGI